MPTERPRRQRKDLPPAPMETAVAVRAVNAPDVPRHSTSKKICHFSCKICYNLAKDPVLNVICGHLFCWSCLFRRGRGKICPFCGCHLDNSDAGLTVAPVYSGRPPSDPPIILNPAKEAVEEAQANGEPDIPLRRPWYANRQFASQSICIAAMITRFKSGRIEFKRGMNCLFASFPPPQEKISYIGMVIAELIKDLQGSWRWLTGKEHESEQLIGDNVAKETGELPEEEEARICWSREESENLEIVLSPTINDFPIHLSYFSCGICEGIAFEPVVSECGHLFCWTCLYRKTTSGSPGCPVCEKYVNVYSSRNNINPIYCKSNEEEILKLRRRNENEELVPCRLPPNIAAPFLDYMIDRVIKLRDAIMETLNDLEHDQAIKDTVSLMEGQWDELFKDLLIKWRRDSGEQIPEKLLSPPLLDFEYQKISRPETKNKASYKWIRTIVDFTAT